VTYSLDSLTFMTVPEAATLTPLALGVRRAGGDAATAVRTSLVPHNAVAADLRGMAWREMMS
jgi:hypothetical protein